MRISVPFSVAIALVLVGCGGSEVTRPLTPTEPKDIEVPDIAAGQVPNPFCPALTTAGVRAEIIRFFIDASLDAAPRELLEGFAGVVGALATFSKVQRQLDAGNVEGARASTRLLVRFIERKFHRLPPNRQQAHEAAFDRLIGNLWCFVGISGEVFDLNPGDSAKAFDLPAVGGVEFPANIVPVGTLVSLTDLSGGPCPVTTVLDCFPGYLSITTYPQLTLTQPITVVLCPPATAPTDLLVGHQDPTVGFELLPPVPVPPSLAATCSTLGVRETTPATWLARVLREATDLMLPRRLEAAPIMFVGGIGGLTSRFSPFAVVSPTLSAVGGIGGKATSFAPAANPPLPSAYFEGTVGSRTFTGLPSVTIRTPGGDANGSNPVAGVTVTFSTGAAQAYDPDSDARVCTAQGVVPANGQVQVVTDANGVATLPCLSFGNTAGFANLTATFDPASLAFPNANLVTITANDGSASGPSLNWLVVSAAGQPATLGILTAPSPSGGAGEPLVQQPSFQLLDALGNPVARAGVTVTAAVTAGGGTATFTGPVVTNPAGIATFVDLAIGGPVAGVTQTVTFSFSGMTQALTSTVLVVPGPPAQLGIVTPPSPTAQAGVPLSVQPVVSVKDRFGNTVGSTATVQAVIGAGAGALAGTTTVTAVGGVATFTDLRIDGLIGTRSLQFTAGAITSAPSDVVVAAGPAAKLAILAQPSAGAAAGVPFATQPVVGIQDQFGNAVTAPAQMTAVVGAGPGILAGTTTIPTVAGVGTFTDLRFDGTVGGRALQFTSGSLASPLTGTISVGAGPARSIETFMTGAGAPTYSFGSGLTSGVAVMPAPRVLVTDQFGNPVANQAVFWTATGTGGTVTVGPGATTGGLGTAQVDAWVLGIGSNELTAGLFAPGAPSNLPGYRDATFTAATPTTGLSIWACTAAPNAKQVLGDLRINAPTDVIKTVTVRLSTSGTGPLASYPASIQARLDGPTGPLLASATGTVQIPGENLGSAPVTFTFPTAVPTQSATSTIWFRIGVSGLGSRRAQVWYNSGTFPAESVCANSRAYAPESATTFKRGLVIDVKN